MSLTAWIDFWTSNTSIWYNRNNNVKMIKLNKWSLIDMTSVFYSLWICLSI